ncbi:MAG: glycosyltransferase family 25 protein [Paracoccaceae bacterium]
MKLKVLIIHLARAAARLPTVERLRRSTEYECEIVEAIDGAHLSDEERTLRYRPKSCRPHYPFAMRDNEIGCFMSHRKAWRRIVESGLDAALILEDDVEIDPELFGPALKLALTHCRRDSYVRFPVQDRETEQDVLAMKGGVRLYRPEVTGLGCHAQVVGVEAARRLIEVTGSFDRPVDSFLQMHWLSGVSAVSVRPSGTREISKQIGGSNISRKKAIWDTMYREVNRPLYRMQVRWLSKRSAAVRGVG